MAEAETVKPFADRRAMHRDAMNRNHLRNDFVQRQVTLDRQTIPQPGVEAGQLALSMIALRLWKETAALASQDHHVVYKPRRNPEMARRLTVTMSFLNERDHPAPQLDRMWLAHSEPPYLAGSGNHKSQNLGILNLRQGDTL